MRTGGAWVQLKHRHAIRNVSVGLSILLVGVTLPLSITRGNQIYGGNTTLVALWAAVGTAGLIWVLATDMVYGSITNGLEKPELTLEVEDPQRWGGRLDRERESSLAPLRAQLRRRVADALATLAAAFHEDRVVNADLLDYFPRTFSDVAEAWRRSRLPETSSDFWAHPRPEWTDMLLMAAVGAAHELQALAHDYGYLASEVVLSRIHDFARAVPSPRSEPQARDRPMRALLEEQRLRYELDAALRAAELVASAISLPSPTLSIDLKTLWQQGRKTSLLVPQTNRVVRDAISRGYKRPRVGFDAGKTLNQQD